MALRAVPRHRIDATPKFVSAYDPSWRDRLDRELEEDDEAEIRAAQTAVERAQKVARGEDLPEEPPQRPKTMHPQRQYAAGLTRFDIDAPISYRGEDVRITDYLDGDQTYYVLGSLPPQEWYRIQGKLSTAQLLAQQKQTVEFQEVANDAFFDAFKWGLKGIENGPEFSAGRDGGVSEQTMSEIMRSHPMGASIVHEIGAAVVAYNRALSEEEKKA